MLLAVSAGSEPGGSQWRELVLVLRELCRWPGLRVSSGVIEPNGCQESSWTIISIGF